MSGSGTETPKALAGGPLEIEFPLPALANTEVKISTRPGFELAPAKYLPPFAEFASIVGNCCSSLYPWEETHPFHERMQR